MLRRQAFVRQGSVLLAAALLLSACVGQSTRPTGPTPTATILAQPTPITGLLDPVPADCHPVDPPQTMQFGAYFGFTRPITLLGDGPAWLTSGLAVLHLNQLYGYQPIPSTKMLWAIGPDNILPITIKGQDMRSGAPMWIEIYDSPPDTTAVFQPGASNRGGGTTPDGKKWNIWGTGLIFLKAGCYRITVSWPGGQWQMVSAVGR